MGFTVFFFLSWLVISVFSVISSTKYIVENTFTYLITLTISINYSWIIIEEMKLISLTQKGLPYTAYLLNRSIILPLVVLISIHYLIRAETFAKKLAVMTAAVLLLVAMSFISQTLGILTYKGWNLGFDGLYYFILLMIAFFSYHTISRISGRVVA
ncbi:hypothetical protein [Bacillus sp. SG-1]|uniref:hypothetical protein n=1 Tax=Bacillus sp. SG-1 TaxID=161544 RepID=UPI0003038FD9|nr:hypothetical protein [Bacillus sp. SG-1]